MYCTNCGKEIDKNADVCLNCGTLIKKNNQVEDSSNIGLNIISFLWPIVGLILYLTMKDTTPIRAKECGKWALISAIIRIVLVILYIIFFMIILVNVKDNNNINDNYNIPTNGIYYKIN